MFKTAGTITTSASNIIETSAVVAENLVVEAGEALVTGARTANKALHMLEAELDLALAKQKAEHAKELEALDLEPVELTRAINIERVS